MNSNKEMKKEEREKFREKVRNFLKEEMFNYIIPNRKYTTMVDSTMKVSVKLAIEVGKKTKYTHAHAIIKVNHNTNLMIDAEYIRENLGTPHVNVRYAEEIVAGEKTKRYLEKEQ